jgi:hypothetical protein
MKVYGALELAQLEWFLDSAKPSAASFIYRVIYVSDLKQIQVSDGTNWIPFLNTSTNQTLSGNITFNGQQIFNGLHRLSVTTNSATGAIVALAPTTPITEFTGAVTSVSGITSGASGATVMFINRSGSPFTVLDEDAGATAGNRIRTGTGASITLTNNASILLSYAGDSRWHVVGGTGSSSSISGAKNYFVISSANSNFSQNSVSPWSACTLTFTSGVPSAAPTLTATQMAIAATATNPLLQSQSNYNLQLTKSAANAQYQGFISGELTIDREDLAKVLTGSFSYEVASGTVDFSGTSAQDLEIWVYNTVSGAWTQPAGFRGINTSSGTGVVSFTFQTDSTAANNKYKIAVITQQTSATAYSVNFNDFSVGPTAVINGTPVTDFASYTMTGSWTANTTYTGKYRRVGDSIEIQGRILCSGAPTPAGVLSVNLPSGLSIDTNKINLTTQPSVFGSVMALDNGVQTYAGIVSYNTATSVRFILGTNGTVQTSAPFAFGNTDEVDFMCVLPITGFSSNVQISSDTDTRVVASSYFFNSIGVTGGADLAGIWTQSYDTHAAFTNANGRFTAPVSGYYRVSVVTSRSTGVGNTFQLYKNGTFYAAFTSYPAAGYACSGSVSLPLNAGEYLTFRIDTTLTSSSAFYIERLSGPSVVAASETVAASGRNTSGLSIPNNSSTTVTTPTIIDSSHGALASSGVFTAPISGRYSCNACIGFQSNASGIRSVEFFKNSSTVTGIATSSLQYSGNQSVYSASGYVTLNAGETVEVKVLQTSGGALSLSTSTNYNLISIFRVGN